jgi:UDP-N-acetylmuramyl pentapeptide phosphotransferase/UDP-N-acetylglucosamine-1-phosphate transferase
MIALRYCGKTSTISLFWVYNLHTPKTKTFAGDVGSISSCFNACYAKIILKKNKCIAIFFSVYSIDMVVTILRIIWKKYI